MSDEKAILVAANPYEYYQVTDTRKTRDMGDVEVHRQHLNRHGGVFWDVVPPGRLDTPWKHPDIKSGYFYISKDGMVKYRMSIEFIKRWKDINLEKVGDYIPEFRRTYLKFYPSKMYYYAILIRELEPLRAVRKLGEFTLCSTQKPVERVQNYVFVYDPGYR